MKVEQGTKTNKRIVVKDTAAQIMILQARIEQLEQELEKK